MHPYIEKLVSRLFLGIPTRFSLQLFGLYAIAHIGLFAILNSIYWDDWTLYGQPKADLMSVFHQAGSMFNVGGHLHVVMLKAGPWLYRVLTFFLGLYSAILSWHILNRQAWLGIERRNLAVLLFATSPLFAAKVALIDFPYTLCLFLFLLAWRMMEKNRAIALTLFFFSFNTNSLLMLFALPMLDQLLREKAYASIRALLSWSGRWFAFLIVPFAFWYIKTAYYKPSGLYAGYNEQFNFASLWYTPEAILLDLGSVTINLFLAAAVFIGIAAVYRQAALETSYKFRIILVACLAFLPSVLPYLMLGHIPTFYEWTSRHQVLMSIPLSLAALWLVAVLPVACRGSVATLLLSLGIALNIQIYNEFASDWTKQKYIMAQLQKSDLLKQASLVVFDDTTENARKRVYRFYELNGILRQAHPDRRQFGVPLAELYHYRGGGYDRYFNSLYVADGHIRNPAAPTVTVKIRAAAPPTLFQRPQYLIDISPLKPE